MIRLSVLARSAREVVLAVDGELTGRDVEVLATEIPRWLERCPRLVLDLHGTGAIDAAALELLRQWAGPRLALRGNSPYQRALLATEGLVLSEE